MNTLCIGPDSLVTLQLRIAQETDGAVVFSNFETTPMTVKLGSDEMMPALEKRLLGLATGRHETYHFAPGEAFGSYDETLVERIARKDIPAELNLEPDTVFSFPAPDGSSYPGLVKTLNNDFALIDFNHPLAGKAVAVEVKIIGIL